MAKTGEIYVLVIEGRNIIPKDWGGSSDPYCKVYLDKRRVFKTPIIKKCLEPKWEESARTLAITSEKPVTILKFSLWDFDRFKWDEFLGEILVPIEELYDGVPRDDWYPLKPRKGKSDKVTGDLHLQIIFLEPGDSITLERFEFPYPLQTLMRKKRFQQFQNALKTKDLEKLDNNGQRPLHAACFLDLPDCVVRLLDSGANIKGGDEKSGAHPLHYAGAHSHNCIAPLLAKGAEIEGKDRNERTPMHFAAVHNNANSISVLVEREGKINAQDSSGQTPLHLALKEKECWSSIRMLVDKGADIYLEDKNGISPAKLCLDELRVTDRTKREFMNAVKIKDDREFDVRRALKHVYYVEGKNLSYEWGSNEQFCLKPKEGVSKITILMHYVYEDKSAKQMEKTGFVCITSDEGIHKEPSYQQDLLGYGSFEPFSIEVKPDSKLFYVVIPYSKSKDVFGYYDIIVYSDGELEISELINWNHNIKVEGEWTPELSGGDKSLETWLSNPQFTLRAPKDVENNKLTMSILLTQAKSALDLIPYQVLPYQFYIGYYVLDKDLFEIVAQCPTWRNAQEIYIHFTIDTSKDNEFVLIPTTHFAGQLTSFTITVFSDVPVELEKRN